MQVQTITSTIIYSEQSCAKKFAQIHVTAVTLMEKICEMTVPTFACPNYLWQFLNMVSPPSYTHCSCRRINSTSGTSSTCGPRTGFPCALAGKGKGEGGQFRFSCSQATSVCGYIVARG